jgi:hypothetical protein
MQDICHFPHLMNALQAFIDDPLYIDGHVWIEREHVTVNKWMPVYNTICDIRGVKQTMVLLEAPIETQTIILQMMEEKQRMFLRTVASYDDTLKECLLEWFEGIGGTFCWQQAILEQQLRGGELKMGSLGFGSGESDKIWWEFGGANYKDVHEFIGRRL